MTRWKTDAIIALLIRALPDLKEIKNEGQGGDCDTDNLIVHFRNCKDKLFIKGFVVESEITNSSDAHVDHVEVTDGKDSRGGLFSSEEPVCIAYGIVCARLRRVGFDVVTSLNDYF